MEKKKIIIELTKETLKKLRELGEAKQRTRKNYIEYILENLAKA